jgi:hypothetical protein
MLEANRLRVGERLVERGGQIVQGDEPNVPAGQRLPETVVDGHGHVLPATINQRNGYRGSMW